MKSSVRNQKLIEAAAVTLSAMGFDEEQVKRACRALAGTPDHPRTDTLKGIVSRRQAAEMLNVTTKTITTWAHAGYLKPVFAKRRDGHSIGYTHESVQAMLNGGIDITDEEHAAARQRARDGYWRGRGRLAEASQTA